MNDALATVIGATVGAVAAMIGGVLSGRRERAIALESWKRERTDAEEKWNREQRRSESEWFREKLLETYSNSIYYFMKLGMSAKTKSTEDRNVRQHYAEAHRNLLLLRAFHNDEIIIATLTRCSKALDENYSETIKLAAAADGCCITVGKLMKSDNRIQPQHQLHRAGQNDNRPADMGLMSRGRTEGAD